MDWLVFKHEPLATCHREFEDMAIDYYRSTRASVGVPPLDFNWDQFLTLERNGQIVCVTAREQGMLVGIVFYIVSMHPQHRTWKVALCNTLAVAPKFRGKDIGRRLMRVAEPILKRQGVARVTHMYRNDAYGNSVTPIFVNEGYTARETAYSKDL